MQQEPALTALLTSLLNSPAPASVPRVTAAGLAVIDSADFSLAINTLHALAVRHAQGPHALTVFYIFDSALKQVQRQREAEAFLKAVTKQFPALWNAVVPLLDSERVQRFQRLVSSWESRSLLPPLNLTIPPPGHHSSPPTPVTPPVDPTPTPTPTPTPGSTPAPASPAAVKPAPPVVHPAISPHAPLPTRKPHGHPSHPVHKPHAMHYPDEDAMEPFAGAGGSGVWNAQYVAVVDLDLEFGDKILLPASALKELTLLSVKFPILLQIRNPANNKRTYVGVREFSAPEGRCVLPRWVLSNVEGNETRRLHIRTVDLPLCTYAKLRPLGNDFARVTDPKALLEALLRYFSALTLHHTLHLHGAHSYDFEVTELHPADAVCIIDTTMEVEFEGLETPPAEATAAAPVPAAVKDQGWRQGSGDSWARDNPSVVVKTCGNCGSKVPQEKWALHEAVCYRQNFGCPKCGKKMKIADKAQHLAEAHAPVKCPACDAGLESFQLAAHTAKECPARMVTCRYCSLSFQARALGEHEGYCGSRTEACELCGKRITLATAEKHQTECIAVIET